MKLDMRPMLRGEVSRISVDYMLSPEAISGVTFDGDAHVVGQITNEGGYISWYDFTCEISGRQVTPQR